MSEFTLKQRGPGWRDMYEAVLSDPARALAAPETVMLKRRDAGREVGLIVVGGVRLVVKLYDESGLVNLAERLLLSSAAARAARGGARMTAAGFRAPVLVAVLETSLASRTARSCLVTEAVSGERADIAWPRLSRAARCAFAAALGGYLRDLHRRGVYPQDLWMTNLFAVIGDGKWEFVLVDVDRVRVYWRVSSRRRLKNLVQIERSLGRQARWAERLQFLRSYLGPASRAELVRTAQAVLAAGHEKDVAHGTRRL